jgi:hypothetical protein
MDGTATDDELVEGIVAELKPFREQWDGTTPDVAAVTQGVWNEINSQRQMIPSLYDRSVITATRDDARAILDAIETLQDMLAAAGRELRMRLKLDSDRPPVFEALDDVRKECERAVTQSLTSGRKDQVKRHCVQRACVLIQKYSQRKPFYSDDNDIFPRVASLVYEIVAAAGDNSAFLRLCKEHMNRRTFHPEKPS